MKRDDVKIGSNYKAKVSDKLTIVRIDAEHAGGGWEATNLATGKQVRIKSAQRLHGPASAPKAASGGTAGGATDATTTAAAADTGQQGGNSGKATKRAKKKLTKKERDALRAEHKADQENARLRDQREAAPDGMTASERAMTESAPATRDATAAKPRKKREGMSCLDAAAKVLAEAGEPMNTKAMVEAMAAKAYWTSDAPTPSATLYSAILREIQKKGDQARFIKAERGKFALTNRKEG